MEETKQTEIDILCRKYFAPELCSEPVTENSAALKNKIGTQLLRYGKAFLSSKHEDDKNYIDECIQDAIGNCWKKWKEETPDSYTAYYRIVLKNCLNNSRQKKRTKREKEMKLDAPLNSSEDDEGLTKGDQIPDSRFLTPEEKAIDSIETSDILRQIDGYIHAARSDIRNRLAIVFTYRLLTGISSHVDREKFIRWHGEHSFITTELVDDYFRKLDSCSDKGLFRYTHKDICRLYTDIPEQKITALLNKTRSFCKSLEN